MDRTGNDTGALWRTDNARTGDVKMIINREDFGQFPSLRIESRPTMTHGPTLITEEAIVSTPTDWKYHEAVMDAMGNIALIYVERAELT